MYGNVAGVGLFSTPAFLAFTGVSRGWVVAVTAMSLLFLALGVAFLRASHHTMFR